MAGILSSGRWYRLAMEIRARDDYKCQKCGRRTWGEVDHIEPRQKRPDLIWTPSNLQLLCRNCHLQKTRSENPRLTPGRKEWLEFLDKEYGRKDDRRSQRRAKENERKPVPTD